ncbi:MAG TPA: pyruvate carboxylase [Kiritimatiellia bacterium]|nr:pyruvate carboxylase [Kiritimatiellia bacterium]HMP00194.1 pyruvate carboxylase [Kiritimatiellia bacterium]HMP96724.1 pyruvate carboxylase [Kiritimatiellia bacterium]
MKTIEKLLVANRGEIAIRVFRAAAELGMKTVAVYSQEDRFALHRFKADEAYLIGEGKGPVAAYLDIPSVIAVAKKAGVDAIHPGYGFLSENAAFAQACRDAGILFIGPTPEMLATFGDKLAAKRIALATGVPTVPGTDQPVAPGPALKKAAAKIGYPLILKASFGGGGRGMRVVEKPEELTPKLEEAMREAGGAFGDPAVFLERYIKRARHIEVQILGDGKGGIRHLWERDCSVQRRHQKVVEIAPAPVLDPDVRRRLCEAAVKLTGHVNYLCAGTVEFLVDADTGEFFFIEVNPRVQVEHTVTEMVTGIDIVRSQIMLVQGYGFDDPRMAIPPQRDLRTNGFAIQCRITTEDPENRFIPDYGRILTYRSPAGFGVRLDGGTAYSGAVITPYYDSLLVKVTTYAATFDQAIQRMDRALSEFRIRGVRTNIPFINNLILHTTFRNGEVTTTFIDDTPELFRWPQRRDRATKLLRYISEVAINGNPEVKGRTDGRSLNAPVAPAAPMAETPPAGMRQKLLELGPEKFAAWVLKRKALLITDTTMRDAHQSLLATRVRTADMIRVAPFVAHRLPELFSLEMWGGATFDTAMRFLKEDPFERLDQLRTAVPNILFQMLLRAGNAVGYTNYPDDVVKRFVRGAAEHGIDVFRVFDCLNWLPNLRPAMDAVIEAGAICEPAICYTGDLTDPRRDKYTLDYYVKLAKQLEKAGAHILGIKDMAGLCKPYAAAKLIKALREEIGIPIHFHTHDTAGIQAASIVKAAEAGASIVDGAAASMSGMTSQVNLNAIVEAMRHTPRDTGLDRDALSAYSAYWEQARALYYPFESGMLATTAEVYRHEMPGGQVTNLQEQAKSMGLGPRWPEVARAYEQVNQLFGDIVKVTPTSKVVGDMALFMVANHLTPEDLLDPARDISFPASVVELFEGKLGQPAGGFPKDLQRRVLRGKPASVKRPGELLPPTNFNTLLKELAGKMHAEPTETDLLCYLMYPKVFLDFVEHQRQFGDTSLLPTDVFFYGMTPGAEITCELEPGKSIIIKFLAVGEPDEEGVREVFFELNGQPRSVRLADRSLKSATVRHVKADPEDPGQVASPMPGKVSSMVVSAGSVVKKGDKLLSIEAMKMETAVYAPIDGVIKDLRVKTGSPVESRDLLLVIAPGGGKG